MKSNYSTLSCLLYADPCEVNDLSDLPSTSEQQSRSTSQQPSLSKASAVNMDARITPGPSESTKLMNKDGSVCRSGQPLAKFVTPRTKKPTSVRRSLTLGTGTKSSSDPRKSNKEKKTSSSFVIAVPKLTSFGKAALYPFTCEFAENSNKWCKRVLKAKLYGV